MEGRRVSSSTTLTVEAVDVVVVVREGDVEKGKDESDEGVGMRKEEGVGKRRVVLGNQTG